MALFKHDGRLMKILSIVADLIVLNFMTLVCCAPVITVGASFTALHTCIIRLREGTEGYLYKDFWNAFKKNFKQATIMWLMILSAFLLLYIDYQLFSGISGFANMLQIVVMAMSILVFMITLYVFPMEAYFINPVKKTLRNACLISVSKFKDTVVLGALNVIPFFLLKNVPILFGIYLLLGISGIAWLSSKFYLKIFAEIRIKV